MMADTMRAYVRELEAVLEAHLELSLEASLHSVHLVGHGFGAASALPGLEPLALLYAPG